MQKSNLTERTTNKPNKNRHQHSKKEHSLIAFPGPFFVITGLDFLFFFFKLTTLLGTQK